MRRTFLDEFPALWDSFELKLKQKILESIRGETMTGTKPDFQKLCSIYRDLGWKYWALSSGGGGKWMAQFEEVFFDSRYYPVKSLLYGYGNLDTLADRSLEYVPGQSAGEIYRTAIKTHLDERRQKMIQKLAELEQELQRPMPYTLKVDHQDLYLEFAQRYRRKKQFAGLDGYRYSFNGRTYCDVKSLWKESVEEIAENVQIVTDVYGEKVLKCYTQIPTFDSSDREWDSKEVEFLFFDGKDIHLVIMRGGYKIAYLTFYEKLLSADTVMKPLFQKLGWPESGIKWV